MSATSGPERAPDTGRPSACLVISHYNAWSDQQLIALLDQTLQIPAGMAFHTRVVVNAAVDQSLALPDRHSGVEVLYRENTGYNIGAWNLGWQTAPAFDFYLFLQEECVILRRNWMKAYADMAAKPGVGLVGESLVWEQPWEELEASIRRPLSDQVKIDGRQVGIFECYYTHLRRHGVDRGRDGTHLQSLVLGGKRDVLQRISPWPIGADYGEAVSSEIIISKKVLALELQVRQVAWLPFTYILHPQWAAPKWRFVIKQTLGRWVPWSLRRRIRQALGRRETH